MLAAAAMTANNKAAAQSSAWQHGVHASQAYPLL
jgi:hypothetical protein